MRENKKEKCREEEYEYGGYDDEKVLRSILQEGRKLGGEFRVPPTLAAQESSFPEHPWGTEDVSPLQWYGVETLDFSLLPVGVRSNQRRSRVIQLNLGGEVYVKSDGASFPSSYSLPTSVGNLSHLSVLDLRKSSVQCLPDSIGKLSVLHRLDLRRCINLTILPETVGDLSQLRELDLADCESLTALPDSIGRCQMLRRLSFGASQTSGCNAIMKLPESIGDLLNLIELDLTKCKSLIVLPESLGGLSNLQELQLRECKALTKLPDSIGELAGSLKELGLSKCNGLSAVPGTVAKLRGLECLNISKCAGLTTIPGGIFTNLGKDLVVVDIRGCKNVVTLPDSIGCLELLAVLDLRACKKLKRLPDAIQLMRKLQAIDLRGCKSLERLGDGVASLIQSGQLKRLDITDCTALSDEDVPKWAVRDTGE